MLQAADPGAAAPAAPSPTIPWTVPPQRNSLVKPDHAATSPAAPGANPGGDAGFPAIDLDDLSSADPRSLRFAGRNAAVLDGPGKGVRQREGTKLVDRRGRFEVHGDRVIFFAQEPDAHFVVLENLALERVARVVEESGPQLLWGVTGTLTEYRSSNYLVISRATVKSLPGQVEPRKLADPTAAAEVAPPGEAAPLAPGGSTPTASSLPGQVR